MTSKITLFARRTTGIFCSSPTFTFKSISFFQVTAISKVLGLVTSKTTKAPTASLKYTRLIELNLSCPEKKKKKKKKGKERKGKERKGKGREEKKRKERDDQ